MVNTAVGCGLSRTYNDLRVVFVYWGGYESTTRRLLQY